MFQASHSKEPDHGLAAIIPVFIGSVYPTEKN